MPTVQVVIGAQFGDEGKGKIVDIIAGECDVVCRCQGGNNSDHTVVVNGLRYIFRMIPCGILRTNVMCVLGNGVVLHLGDLFKEIDCLTAMGVEDIEPRMRISERAHIVFDIHRKVDKLEEEDRDKNSLGTTMFGIGPAYSSKISRKGIRVGDFVGDWEDFCAKYSHLYALYKKQFPSLDIDITQSLTELKVYRDRLQPMVRDTIFLINKFASCVSHKLLVECSQSSMLDIDFGSYPYVTSSNCSIGGVCTGLGIAPSKIGDVYGVAKAYTTRIGPGIFPTEILGEQCSKIQELGREFRAITGRVRRVGWLDAVVIRYTHAVNNFTAIAITKLDVLDNFDVIKICKDYMDPELGVPVTSIPSDSKVLERIYPVYETFPGWKKPTSEIRTFEDLPIEAQNYITAIERLGNVRVRWIGVGESREQIITKNS